jgi:hypothetical protein
MQPLHKTPGIRLLITAVLVKFLPDWQLLDSAFRLQAAAARCGGVRWPRATRKLELGNIKTDAEGMEERLREFPQKWETHYMQR